MVFSPEKSYAAATAGGSAPWKPTIVSLNKDACAGLFANQSKMGMPSDFSNPLFPVSSE
jgi:hypothetical protein